VSAHRPVLVIGGTRGTGLLISRLLAEKDVPVRVLARDPARACQLFDRRVAIVHGDITLPETLPAALKDARHVVFTAGCRSGYPVGEASVKATEYDGVINTLLAARADKFAGRLLYMTSSGLTVPSWSTFALNLWKGNTLVWRKRAEAEIRGSGIDYTVIRSGVLLNSPGSRHQIRVTQEPLPLSIRYRIARRRGAAVRRRARPSGYVACDLRGRLGSARRAWRLERDAGRGDGRSNPVSQSLSALRRLIELNQVAAGVATGGGRQR
jgi:uncharacterized protein YbjT (DUF2867 family)